MKTGFGNHSLGTFTSRRAVVRAGFTLIELLVVISIIALLVGILLPALGAARRTATILKCTTQIRQLGVGNAAFETDHGHVVPSWERGGSSYTDSFHARNSWKEVLRDDGYVSAVEVFLCPIVADEGERHDNPSDPKQEEPFGNYRINHQLAGPKEGFTYEGSDYYHHPHSSGDVKKTSRTLMFTDNRSYSGFNWGGSMIFIDWGHLELTHVQSIGNSWFFSPWGPRKVSQGNSAFIMVDGSATTLTFTEDKYDQYDNKRIDGEEYYLTVDKDW